ncbi:unnamed protein product [Arctia plantaginis]|uniref:LITAF domain-containing protein n=1 Tax=Arctia plantaginis TaxID=874455 RepID=A0A8S0ZUK7_ARCPL|nr:unnamed protein product [Arctia plantaginis]
MKSLSGFSILEDLEKLYSQYKMASGPGLHPGYNVEHDGIKLVPPERDLPIQFQNTQILSRTAPMIPPKELNDNNKIIQMQPEMNLLGPENTVTTCQFCRASIKTAVKYTTTSRTHMAAALWGMICCLCCVPYGAESAKNSDHYCPACQRYLGTYVK